MSVTTSPNLDDFLLDIATAIELSNRDRQVAENRYRRLKERLERPTSPLAPYLANNESRIYPQGSMATGTTVVTGTDEDRFDLDALVEVKADKSPEEMMDLLYESLKDFPDALEVVRCTRCVQLRFAFMHMDVTLMDPNAEPRTERAGEIFHCPDEGASKRVPANPYGFSLWFRASVNQEDTKFAEALNKRRVENAIDRISKGMELRAAEQDDLPHVLPPRLDSEQVVALKLLKRYLYMRYEERDVKRPPSIYISKLAADVGDSPYGLCAQLAALAHHIKGEMDGYIANGRFPDERNPSYDADRLNDRWPTTAEDMKILSGDMSRLIKAIERARSSDFMEINKIFAELFGERITKRSAETVLARASAEHEKPRLYEKGTGAVILTKAAAAPAVALALAEAPRQHFHCEVLK